MGCPSAGIVIEELTQLGVKKILRVGTCGGLQPDMTHGRPDRRALRHAGRLDRDPPDRRRAARADRRLGARPRRRPPREGARQEGARRRRRLERRLLQPGRRAVPALVGPRHPRRRDGGGDAVHARRAEEDPGRLPPDRQRRRRRGRVQADHRRGHARRGRPDDRARARRPSPTSTNADDRLPRQPRVGRRDDRPPLAGARAPRVRARPDGDVALLRAAGAPRASSPRRRPRTAPSSSSPSAATAPSTRSRPGIVGLGGVELAVIPRGTGVDFVRTYGIPTKLDDAVDVALHGATREIDAGRVGYRAWSGDAGEGWFVNVAGVGMSGAVAKRTNESSKALGGKVVVPLVDARRLRALAEHGGARHGRRRAPRRRRMHEVVVANGRYLGGGMMICPEASPDDGLFDVLLIGDVTKLDLVRTMPKIYRGHAPPPPEGGAAPRAHGRRSTRPSRCRSSSTASSRGRRRCASSSCRGRCGCACRPPSSRTTRACVAAGLRAVVLFRAVVVLLRAGFDSSSSRCSSSATRFSSGSRLRMRLETRPPARAGRSPASTSLVPPGSSASLLDRLLAAVGQPLDDVLLLLLLASEPCVGP